MYLFELFHQFHLADVNAGPVGFPIKEGGKKQSQHTVKRMYLDLLVGPMEHREPARIISILHSAKGLLYVSFIPEGSDNLFVTPVVIVGKQDGLSEKRLRQSIKVFHIKTKGKNRYSTLLFNTDLNEIFHMLPLENLSDLFLHRLDCGDVPLSPAIFLPQFKTLLQNFELALGLLNHEQDSFKLFGEEIGGEDNHHGMTGSKNFTLVPIDAHPVKSFIFKTMVLIIGYLKKILEMAGNEGADKVVFGSIQFADGNLRIVTLVKDHGDFLTSFGHHLQPLYQFINNRLKAFGIHGVAFITLMKQRDVVVPAHQKSQVYLAKVKPLLFVLAPKGNLAAPVEGVDIGKEVCGIIDKCSQVNVVKLDDPPGNSLLYHWDCIHPDHIHMVPEPLGCELAGFDSGETMGQHRLKEPIGDGAFAFGMTAPVDGGNKQIFSHRDTLVSFRDEVIDDLCDTQPLSDMKLGGFRPKAEKPDRFGADRLTAFTTAMDNIIRSAQVFLPDQSGFAVYAAALNCVVVGAAFNDTWGNGSHSCIIPHPAIDVKHFFNFIKERFINCN